MACAEPCLPPTVPRTVSAAVAAVVFSLLPKRGEKMVEMCWELSALSRCRVVCAVFICCISCTGTAQRSFHTHLTGHNQLLSSQSFDVHCLACLGLLCWEFDNATTARVFFDNMATFRILVLKLIFSCFYYRILPIWKWELQSSLHRPANLVAWSTIMSSRR